MSLVILKNGSFHQIKEYLPNELDAVFCIHGNHFRNQTFFTDLQKQLSGNKLTFFEKKSGDLFDLEIKAATVNFQQLNHTVIIAIGGGSVIDLAKGILFETSVLQKRKKTFFIALPTTSGSGSEATQFAVYYTNKEKKSIDHQFLLPDVSILDVNLTLSLTNRQIAISGMDALSQAIESIWNIYATEESRKFSAEAIKILLYALPKIEKDRKSLPLHENLLHAAHLSGKAINITRTTGPHAMSYYLTANYQIPHGQAVALFLPVFLAYNSKVTNANCAHPDGVLAVLQSLSEIYTLLQVANAEEAISRLQKLMQYLGLETKLEQLGINKELVLDNLTQAVNQQRFCNNPVTFNPQELKNLCNIYL